MKKSNGVLCFRVCQTASDLGAPKIKNGARSSPNRTFCTPVSFRLRPKQSAKRLDEPNMYCLSSPKGAMSARFHAKELDDCRTFCAPGFDGQRNPTTITSPFATQAVHSPNKQNSTLSLLVQLAKQHYPKNTNNGVWNQSRSQLSRNRRL